MFEVFAHIPRTFSTPKTQHPFLDLTFCEWATHCCWWDYSNRFAVDRAEHALKKQCYHFLLFIHPPCSSSSFSLHYERFFLNFCSLPSNVCFALQSLLVSAISAMILYFSFFFPQPQYTALLVCHSILISNLLFVSFEIVDLLEYRAFCFFWYTQYIDSLFFFRSRDWFTGFWVAFTIMFHG